MRLREEQRIAEINGIRTYFSHNRYPPYAGVAVKATSHPRQRPDGIVQKLNSFLQLFAESQSVFCKLEGHLISGWVLSD